MSIHRSLRTLNDKDAVARVTTDFEYAKSDKLGALVRAERYNNIYEALDPPDEQIDETTALIEDDKGSYSNNYLPVGAAVVDSAVSQLYNGLFSTPEYFEIDENDWEDGFVAQKITQHQLLRHRQMKLRYKVMTTLQQACCFDYAITGCRWLLRPGYVNKREIKTYNVKYGGVSLPYQQVEVKPTWIPDAVDRSDFFVLDYMNTYLDPEAGPLLTDSAFVIDERWETIDNLRLQAKTSKQPWGKYKNVETVIKMASAKWDNATPTESDPQQGSRPFNSRRVKIVRYWTADHLIEIASGLVIFRMNMTGLPLQIWKIFERNSKLPGMGLLQRMERNQYDINASMNANRNFQNLVADPWVVLHEKLVGRGEGISRPHPGRAYTYSGSAPAKDMVYVYTPGTNNNQDAMTNVNQQIEVVEKVTKVSENAQGSFAKGRRSATEASFVQAGVASEMLKIGQKIEDIALEPAYLELFKLEQIFMTREERFKAHGKYADMMMRVSPEDYKWASVPGFTAKGITSLANDPVQNQQFLAVVDRAMAMPQVPHDWEAIFTEMWRRFAPKNYEKFIKDPSIPQENIPPEIENMMFAMGRYIPTSPLNDSAKHLQSHNALKFTQDYKFWPEQRKQNLERHIAEHQQGGAPQGNQLQAGSEAAGPTTGSTMQGLGPPALSGMQ